MLGTGRAQEEGRRRQASTQELVWPSDSNMKSHQYGRAGVVDGFQHRHPDFQQSEYDTMDSLVQVLYISSSSCLVHGSGTVRLWPLDSSHSMVE